MVYVENDTAKIPFLISETRSSGQTSPLVFPKKEVLFFHIVLYFCC